jgi:hypothetical protein
MNMIPFVSLKHIEIDPELVCQLPRKLAYYHLALPLAMDNKQITVALAHTGNPSTLEMLSRFLGAEIVPVHATAIEIKAALDSVWKNIKYPQSNIMTWGTTPQHAQQAHQTGDEMGVLFKATVNELQGEDVDSMLLLTQQDDYMLTVVSAPTAEPLIPFIRTAGTPVLLLLGDSAASQTNAFGRILLSLRGHSPDLSALELAIPLAKQHQAEMTVLAVTGVPKSDRSALNRFSHSLAALLDPEQEPAQHLTECTNRLVSVGINGYLKLCQGDPIEQIVTEYAKGQYGLLMITSEAYGDFVQQVITNLQAQGQRAAVLVIRPTSAA